MRTIEINWKGKIGYGDIISPLCYSHVLAVKNSIEVQLNMYWETSKGHLFKEKDSESLDYRQRFLFDLIEPVQPKVTLNQYFNEKLDYNHDNYDPTSPHHNFWYSKIKNTPGDYIVLNTTENNLQQFKDYSKHKQWKDPLGIEGFHKLKDILSVDYKIIEVDYSTPITTVVDLYKNCYCAIGYHGSTMWVARYLRTPLIVFSSDHKISKYAFPWAKILNNVDNFDLELFRNESIHNLGLFEYEHIEYLKKPNLHRLRCS